MPEETQNASLKLDDIYYVLFKHKWMILLFAAAGILVAAGIYFAKQPVYESEAKLLLRYVLEKKTAGPVSSDSQIESPDNRGESIINSELEILGSLDLALQVAKAIGPDQILGKSGGGTNQAAVFITKNLRIEVPRRSSIIQVGFQHPDPATAQLVLGRLIEYYLKKHVEIHRGVGILDDLLSRQAEDLRTRLTATEDKLREVKSSLGVISLDDAKRTYGERISKIQEDLLTAEAELEEHKAAVAEVEKLLPSKSEGAASELGVPLDKLNEYKSVCAQWNSYLTNEAALLTKFTEENPVVKRIRELKLEAEGRKKKMEAENPKLATLGIASSTVSAPPVDPTAEFSRIKALEAKIKVLNVQLEKIRTEMIGIDKAESQITRLQRQRELEETNYRYYSASLEQARLDEALGTGKVTNISTVQEPSPPVRVTSKLKKPIGMALAGGLLGGLALAFLIELFLNQSVRRAIELETRLRLPLFFTIPDTSKNGRSTWAPKFPRRSQPRLLNQGSPPATVEPGAPPPSGEHSLMPWDDRHVLRSHYEALRDQLVAYFELKSLVHKPKLVAVTGCSPGSGVSTIATGLAAALSETGDGNVLLVDMTLEQGAAHPFYQGKPVCSLPDALEEGKQKAALVGDHLYLVSVAGDDQLSRALPKRFTNLVPKLKASNYDYIIFDMPPVSQASVTSRLAGFMDMVFVVAECEKTNREVLKRAASLLADSHANIQTIFNKNRTYVPPWLHQEL